MYIIDACVPGFGLPAQVEGQSTLFQCHFPSHMQMQINAKFDLIETKL